MHSRLLIKCVNICITFKLKSWVLYTIVVLTFAAYAVKAEADAAAGGIEPMTKYPNVARFTPAGDLIYSLLDKYISSGCKGAKNAIDQSEANDILNGGYSVGEKRILLLLLRYFDNDCKDFHPGKEDPSFSTGEKYIIKLLSSYFSSGCKVAVDAAVEVTQSPDYSGSETMIIKLLSSYFSSPTCKEPSKATDNGTDRNSGSNAAGHHVQSVLELFLLMCGVYFTRVELFA